MMKAFLKIHLYIICVMAAASVKAQYSFNDAETVTATVQPVVNLTLTKNNTASLNFNTSSEYLNGITIPNFNTYKIKSNVPWIVNVSSATVYFSASGSSSSPNMPAGVLGFTVGSSATVYSLSTTARTIATGTRGNELSSGNTFNVNLIAKPNYDYGPGIYTIAINYTLTAQ